MRTMRRYASVLLLSGLMIAGCSYIVIDQLNGMVGGGIKMPITVMQLENPPQYQIQIADESFYIDSTAIKNTLVSTKETIQSFLDKVQYTYQSFLNKQ